MNVGIDVGSLFLKAVVLDDRGRLLGRFTQRHAGRPEAAFEAAVERLGLERCTSMGFTGDRAGGLADALGLPVVDTLRATIRGVLHRAPGVRNVVDAGGASITLVELDEDGALRTYETNSLCAAGTGSFLDAQADRLGIEPEETAEFRPVLEPPTIASRCTVFAKSDLIHRQQEGYDREALWCGLCRGLASTLLQTLLRGRSLEGDTVVVGGVSRNREVMRWLSALQDAPVRTYPGAELAGAEGAALVAAEEGLRAPESLGRATPVRLRSRNGDRASTPSRPPLRLERTRYPTFEVREAWEDELGNEIRVTRWATEPVVRGYLGIDVGSTSTKLVLVNEDGDVLVDIYRRTAGDPIGATKHLFTALERLAEREGGGAGRLRVAGCGTTGSGRKLVGAVIRADAVVNEISAHVAGALATDPAADTIFEIGGQDSKFIRVRDGIIRDVNMNYVCAAGTGSFVEEQARKLGYAASELGDLVCGVAPPSTSDRCTVFMQEDMEQLLREGYSPAEALAAVHYSVVQNYLSKVVGTRPYSRKKIFFCGATARNRGLVAAFEQLLGAEMVVSPYCHVLGALGVARLARDEMRRRGSGTRTRFVGLDLSARRVAIRQEVCDVCENVCRITHAHIEGETEVPSWGYLCGRDPDATEKREAPELEPFEERTRLMNLAVARHRRRLPPDAPVAGLAQALGTYSHRALLQTFLNQLGFHVKLSTPSNAETRERGSALVAAEYCFPAKLAHGHLTELLDDPRVDFVFAPHLVSEGVPPEHSNAYFCPVVSAAPAVVRSAARMNRHPRADRLLSPLMDLRWTPERQARELAETLSGTLGRPAPEIAAAWVEALRAQEDFQTSVREAAPGVLERLREQGRPILLVLGRPYNLFDGGA
ncbi:MAG TPA: acyl-CoA dehydratase activase, partial [Longimicrobiales bacterium]|nr:acyl-CoA dehydratase activase [Longimicrobiales bacterium]